MLDFLHRRHGEVPLHQVRKQKRPYVCLACELRWKNVGTPAQRGRKFSPARCRSCQGRQSMTIRQFEQWRRDHPSVNV